VNLRQRLEGREEEAGWGGHREASRNREEETNEKVHNVYYESIKRELNIRLI
jgi:hypothetical protein